MRSAAYTRTVNPRILTVVCAAVIALSAVSTAFAHAEPAVVKPGDGAILTTAPSTYEIEMSQEMFKDNIGSNDIDIFNSAGEEVTAISAVIDNSDRKRLSVTLPSTLEPGEYRVEWKTLSAEDGDNANGTLTFTYDPDGTADPGVEQLKEEVVPEPTVDIGVTPSGISGAQPSSSLSDSKPNVTWVTTIAVGLVTFVLGAGVSYLFVDRKR